MVGSVALLALVAHVIGISAIGDEVKTTSGTIKGHASEWQPEVSEYLGVPFARPPTGELRFTPPQPFTGTGVINAYKFGDDCPSGAPAAAAMLGNSTNPVSKAILSGLLQVGRPMSDDCLTLNVWTKPQTGEKAKAVLFWVYGGAFFIGNTAAPAYNGARLAGDQDVVVVSANYRTNVFGFPGATGIAENNLGLLDQRKALEWVRDNIAAFGGDPKRITMFGESAGGASVDTYAYAWAQDPIVHGIIAQSGTAGLVPVLQGRGPSGFSGISEKLGCASQGIDCVKTKSVDQVLQAMGGGGGLSIMGGGFGPTPDGKVVLSDFPSRGQSGKFAKVPLLVGCNDNEGGINSAFTGGGNSGIAGLVGGVVTTYMNAMMTCNARDAAKWRTQNGVKAWRYRYYGVWPNQATSPTAGAYHGSDVPMVFGSTEYIGTGISDTPEEAETSKLMMKAWAEFAKDPQNGLTKMGWPTYDEKKQTLIGLGYQSKPGIHLDAANKYDTNCGGITAMLTNFGGMMTGSTLGMLGGSTGGRSGAQSGSGFFGSLFGKGKLVRF